ncbi:MAG TPA: TIGR04013 family B12-binding domain/radical SAM domain-containing protein [Anaeromyxobacteraceae bacterium]|nr:TIGR04013 family B12-binding domain/radical SAM domain-containing protein [Anaeromyxobacteraceae bacterium]
MEAVAALVLVGARPRKAALPVLAGAVGSHAGTRSFPVRVAAPGRELEDAIREAGARGPVVVGWSLCSCDLAAAAQERARLAATGRALHVAGGPHPTADPLGVLRAGFDLAAVGEGERSLPELLLRIASGGDPRGAGLAWVEEGRLARGPRPAAVDLDRSPPFAPDLDWFGPIEITRGCPHACRFCQTAQLQGGRVRHRSPGAVGRFVAEMAARGKRDVRFLSPSALGYGSTDGQASPAAVEELLARAREAHGPGGRLFLGSFPSEVRPEHVSREALAILRRFVANDHLVIGAQTGSERMLAASRRGHGVEEVRRAVRIALEAGFRVKVDLVFGLPGEQEDDARATRLLMRELAGIGAELHGHAFLPLPGTPWQGEAPGALDPETRRELERLASRGRASGRWRRQEALGQALAAAAPRLPDWRGR